VDDVNTYETTFKFDSVNNIVIFTSYRDLDPK